MNKWDFIPTKTKQDPYENILPLPHGYTAEEYLSLSAKDKNKAIDEVIKEIRKINVFPIYYFNEEGIKQEIQSVINKEVGFSDKGLAIYNYEGITLLDYLFPNLHTVRVNRNKKDTIYDRFYDDNILKECLLDYTSNKIIKNMRSAFILTARYKWPAGINYVPLRAKAIYEKFCPENGVIYDFCSGFGGRMLGALSSKKNFTYIGTDPNTETYSNLLFLGSEIEKVTNRKNSFKIYNKCAEDLELPENSVDFCFSCPPFFSLEIYSDEETQSYNKYSTYNSWLENFVRPSIKNCVKAMKQNAIYCVDVEDFTISKQLYTLTTDWIQIAQEEGLVLQKTYPVFSHSRKKIAETNIYVFTKQNCTLNDYTDPEVQKIWEERVQENQRRAAQKVKYIAEYDALGNLLSIYDYDAEILNFTKEEIKKSALKKKRIRNRFFRIYTGNEEILTSIDSSVICQIDDKYFDSFAEAGRYLGVSRQAIHQSRQRKSKSICGHKVIWFDVN